VADKKLSNVMRNGHINGITGPNTLYSKSETGIRNSNIADKGIRQALVSKNQTGN
jgi:hypothetical protein